MIAATTNWAEAAIAMVGILFVTTVITVAIWQVFGTWRARMSVAREEAYRKLATEATELQRRVADELAELRARTQELERLLKEVG
jgi:type VI protein secretion system component VasK